jgi:hypothetical protein
MKLPVVYEGEMGAGSYILGREGFTPVCNSTAVAYHTTGVLKPELEQ